MMKGTPQKIVSKFKISYNLIFNIISNEPNATATINSFNEYISRSMIQDEISGEVNGINRQIDGIKEEINALTTSFKHLRTPVDIIQSYLQLNEQRPSAVNKKRKDIDKLIMQITDDHKFIEKEKLTVLKYNAKIIELTAIKEDHNRANQYIDNSVGILLDLLIKSGFIFIKEENLLKVEDALKVEDVRITEKAGQEYSLTTKGSYAVHLREINCLVFAQLFKDDVFNTLTAKQCAMVFSCFTNITISDKDKALTPKCSDNQVQSVAEERDLRDTLSERGFHSQTLRKVFFKAMLHSFVFL